MYCGNIPLLWKGTCIHIVTPIFVTWWHHLTTISPCNNPPTTPPIYLFIFFQIAVTWYLKVFIAAFSEAGAHFVCVPLSSNSKLPVIHSKSPQILTKDFTSKCHLGSRYHQPHFFLTPSDSFSSSAVAETQLKCCSRNIWEPATYFCDPFMPFNTTLNPYTSLFNVLLFAPGI